MYIAKKVTIFVTVIGITLFNACGAGEPRIDNSISGQPLDCLILYVYPYRDKTESSYFKVLEQYLEKNTYTQIDFRYIDPQSVPDGIVNGAVNEELYIREFIREIESDHPPDLIIDFFYGVAARPKMSEISLEKFADVRELSSRYAPTIFKYLERRPIPWNRIKAILIPMRPLVPSPNVWLIRKDVWDRLGKPDLNTFQEIVDFLSAAKDYNEGYPPGVTYGGNFTEFIPLMCYQQYSSISEITNSGIYRLPKGTRVLSIFDDYPEKLREACTYAYRTVDEQLFGFNLQTMDEFNKRLQSGKWIAAQVPVNFAGAIDFKGLSRKGFSANIKAISISVGETLRAFAWPSQLGLFLPSGSKRNSEVMAFLEKLNQETNVEAAYYGVPGKHYRKTGEKEFVPLNAETKFKDAFSNPFIFMSFSSVPLLFNKYIPEDYRQLMNKTITAASEMEIDPIEGFIFDPSSVQEAFDRYKSTHHRSYNTLVRSAPEDFDGNYKEFAESARKDYQTLKVELQRQINNFIAIGG
ncbi:MAG: hypothetical protein HN368_12590 [Spirochaetales bacterium]|nr:hypothetical protein [Spirochaetales bacterium]